MKFTVEKNFRDFEPWSGAVYTFNAIIEAGKEDAAEAYLEEIAPADGWTETGINDLLWFDSELILEACGISEEEEEEEEEEEAEEEAAR